MPRSHEFKSEDIFESAQELAEEEPVAFRAGDDHRIPKRRDVEKTVKLRNGVTISEDSRQATIEIKPVCGEPIKLDGARMSIDKSGVTIENNRWRETMFCNGAITMVDLRHGAGGRLNFYTVSPEGSVHAVSHRFDWKPPHADNFKRNQWIYRAEIVADATETADGYIRAGKMEIMPFVTRAMITPR